jgi:hypothetical protein
MRRRSLRWAIRPDHQPRRRSRFSSRPTAGTGFRPGQQAAVTTRRNGIEGHLHVSRPNAWGIHPQTPFSLCPCALVRDSFLNSFCSNACPCTQGRRFFTGYQRLPGVPGEPHYRKTIPTNLIMFIPASHRPVSVQPLAPLGVRPAPTVRPDTPHAWLTSLTWGQDGPEANVGVGAARVVTVAKGNPATVSVDVPTAAEASERVRKIVRSKHASRRPY